MSGTYSNRNLPAGRQAKDISRRLAGDMEPVLMNSSNLKKNEVFYTVYRNLEIVGGEIKYDVTKIPAGNVNGEFKKTFGHYHKTLLPEVYEVLKGHAYFLLQRFDGDPANIKEAYIIEASAAERAVVPPGFGHLSINIGSEKLALGNWVGLSGYDYETYRKLRGGCYYILDKGAAIELEKNKNYSAVPELKKLKLKKNLPELGFEKGNNRPLIELKNTPEKMDWLINPEKYKDILTIEKLYRIL